MPASALFLSSLPPSNSLHPPPPPRPRLLPQSPNSPSSSSRSFRPPRFCCLLDGSSTQERENAPNFPLLEKPWAQSSDTGGVKMPTAPWMRGPLLLPFDDVLDLSESRKNKKKKKADQGRGDRSLTEKVRGGRSRQAMRKIVQSVARLREIIPPEEVQEEEEEVVLERAVESVLRVMDKGNDHEDEEEEEERRGEMPWVGAEKMLVFPRTKKERMVTSAEMTLPQALLLRLRGEARKLTRWVKAKKAGVTQNVVDEIREAWRRSELAMVKFDVPLCRNMDRVREIVEIKTGGLVVWSKKDTVVVYRGISYQTTSKDIHISAPAADEKSSSSELICEKPEDNCAMSSAKCNHNIGGIIFLKDGEEYSKPDSKIFFEVDDGAESISGTLYEREANRLLDGLGPRFIDWWWPQPLPVDADLLPEVVPDFKPPFRLCPPHMTPKLRDAELTYLRKLSHPLPTHFALGKNSKLQGLAAAIIKLWEKSLIAKIAVKWGIPNTNNEQMACELKHLTGGVLVLRNKFFIILYRGKDYLPGKVANSIFKRETELEYLQFQEEQARLKAVEAFHSSDDIFPITSTIGTFAEFEGIRTYDNSMKNESWEVKVQIEAEKEVVVKELRKQEHQLLILKRKMEKAEKELANLSSAWRPSEQAADQELVTEEERQTFRKIGLKMDEFLLLGRRGIYDGIIRSIHMHWKHREVVKVVTMQRKFSQITYTASLLEIESGGILVAVEKLRRGHAIIIYRGKNYQVPLKLLPDNLLTKRESLKQSIEMQRRGSLKFFAYQRQKSIWGLKCKLRDLEKRIME